MVFYSPVSFHQQAYESVALAHRIRNSVLQGTNLQENNDFAVNVDFGQTDDHLTYCVCFASSLERDTIVVWTWRPTWLVAINHVSSTILINDSFKVKYQWKKLWKKLMTYPLTRHLRAWFYRIPIRSRSQRHLQSLLVLLMLTTLTLLHSSDHWLIELSIDEADFPLKAWNANSVLNLAVVPSKSSSHAPFTWDSTWRSQIGITFPFLSQQCAIPHGLRGIITNLIVWNGSIILTMSRTLALFTDLAFARRLSWETIPTDPIPLDKKAKRQMWRILSKSWWSKCTTKDSSSNLFGIAAHLNLQLMRHSKLEIPNWRRHRLHPSLSINGWKGTNHPIVTTGKAVDPVRL